MFDLALLSFPEGVMGTFVNPVLSFADEASAHWGRSRRGPFLPAAFPGLASVFSFTFPLTFLAFLKGVQLVGPTHISHLVLLRWHVGVGGLLPLLCVGLFSPQTDPGSSPLDVSI